MQGPSDRCQSSIDFIIGFGVFFMTLSFVVTIVPELLSPFTGPHGPVVADRAIDTLSRDVLSTGTPGTLDETRTVAFFEGTSPIATVVGVSESHSLNVTLERTVSDQSQTEIVCYDDDIGAVEACTDGADRLVRGESPPTSTSSVHTASRVVRVDGKTFWLKLRVW